MPLEVITGPMFAGKTEELMRRLRRWRYTGLGVLVLKPKIDTRQEGLQSHAGDQMRACSVSALPCLASRPEKIIGVDEFQFFNQADAMRVVDATLFDKTLIVAGLDLNFAGSPFNPIAYLMPFADRVTKLSAICTKCRVRDATRSLRLSDTVTVISIGAEAEYAARCLPCWLEDRREE